MGDIGDSRKRESKRVTDHHIIRVKRTAPSAESKWDVCIIKNISNTGALFYSSNYYEVGSEVQIGIFNPILLAEINCSAKIVRCLPLVEMKGMYSVALEFQEMTPSDKEALNKLIDLFLKKKKKEEDA